MRTKTDVSGYTVTFDYDALDRVTRITHPDGTFEQTTYNRLQPSVLQDRIGRQILLEYSPLGQLTQRTDPLGRVTLFQWCSCGDIKSLTDPMGRTTTWRKDVQNRIVSKQYGDGSQIIYNYENTTRRLRQVVDEKLQSTEFNYNFDDTISSIAYANATVATPPVSMTYDPNYARPTSMTDGTGTTLYTYNPITIPPGLGAGKLAGVNGPLPNETITYDYDELGRPVSTAINGVATFFTFNAAGQIVAETNTLGLFSCAYDGSSERILSETFPNGQTTGRTYGTLLQDFALQRLTHLAGAMPVSEFIYGWDIPADRITSWSQQIGAQSPSFYAFAYDAVNQLLSGLVTNAGLHMNTFAYSYDLAGNRLTEQAGGLTNSVTCNALNQLNASSNGSSRTNEWDAENRLVAVNSGNQRTEFAYDGLGRFVSIRQLTNGSQASLRQFVWCGDKICEERNASGAVTKRYFKHGLSIVSGPTAGNYYYTRDHLGSIRELTDSNGTVRAEYDYDPFGRRTRLSGDMDADFGFAGMFWSPEAGLALTRYRAYDSNIGRWLSRDPLRDAEVREGANLYAYVRNNPVNLQDHLGLCCTEHQQILTKLDYYHYYMCLYWQTHVMTRLSRWLLSTEEETLEECGLADDAYFEEKTQDSLTLFWDCFARPCACGSKPGPYPGGGGPEPGEFSKNFGDW